MNLFEYKSLSLTYNVLTATQPAFDGFDLHQFPCCTRSLSVVTINRHHHRHLPL